MEGQEKFMKEVHDNKARTDKYLTEADRKQQPGNCWGAWGVPEKDNSGQLYAIKFYFNRKVKDFCARRCFPCYKGYYELYYVGWGVFEVV